MIGSTFRPRHPSETESSVVRIRGQYYKHSISSLKMDGGVKQRCIIFGIKRALLVVSSLRLWY